MDKIKPYMFWIICGVVLLIELVLAFTLDPVNADGNNVYKATKKLNDTVEDFGVYVEKAGNKPPKSFAIDNVDYFKQLQKEYLVSKSWMAGLNQVQSELREHKQNVESDLRKRSEVLHSGVSIPNAPLFRWYKDYNDKTVALLSELHKAEQLTVIGNDPLANAENNERVDELLANNATLRKVGGFYTKGAEFPTEEEHPVITTRFRISEAIINALLEAEGSLIENSMVSFNGVNFVAPPEGVVKPGLVEITWDSFGGGKWDSENEVAIKGGRAINFKVKLSGSASALLAATANIEKSQQPVFVIHGSEWEQPRRKNPEAVKQMDRPILLTLRLAVLDYQGGAQ